MTDLNHPKYEDFLDQFEKIFGDIPNRKRNIKPIVKRKDYCYSCNNDVLYPHVMTLKCIKCDKIILGGV